MIRWLRYGKPRPYILRFTGRLPQGWFRAKMLDWLYPPDAVIRFK